MCADVKIHEVTLEKYDNVFYGLQVRSDPGRQITECQAEQPSEQPTCLLAGLSSPTVSSNPQGLLPPFPLTSLPLPSLAFPCLVRIGDLYRWTAVNICTPLEGCQLACVRQHHKSELESGRFPGRAISRLHNPYRSTHPRQPQLPRYRISTSSLLVKISHLLVCPLQYFRLIIRS